MTKVIVKREPDDTRRILPNDMLENGTILRASIGGTEKAGYYLTYRGDPNNIRHMLQTVMAAFEKDREFDYGGEGYPGNMG